MKRKLYFLLVLFACCLLSITQAKPECNEYKCSFLDCEPFSIQTTILVRDTLSIFSNSEKICKGSIGFFYTNTSDKVRWEIYDSNNSLIYSGKSDTLSYTFDISDSYKITASGARYSTTAEYRVTVLENPPALTTTQGPNVACLFGSILLSGMPTHPNYYLEWETQCTFAPPSSVSGDEVTITYSGEVCDVAVYQVHNEYGCRSQAYIHEVDTFVLAPHGLPAVTHTCAGSTVNIEIPNQAPNVLYEWKLFPPNAASIQGDHLQPDIDVLTNHLYNFVSPTIVNMQLTRKFCAQEIVEIVRLSIEDVETPTLEFPDTVCANELVTEFYEQFHKGSERVAIDCVPAIELTYNCNGYIVITDISKYKNGYTIPERTYTIPDVGSVSMLYPTMVDSINVGIPTDTITYVVNMSMNNSECTYSQSITLTPHPTITDIEFSPKMCINTPFQFTANTTGDIRNYKWDFGDNSYNYGNNIFHTYHTDLDNQFLVQLTVTDRWGCSATDTVYVDVGGTEPNGNLEKLGNDVCMGEARVIAYQQQFAVAPILAHYYWRPNEIVTLSNWRTVYKTGDYTVLVVTNDYGCKVEDITNVGFLNTPTARITGNATYCFGEKVKLYGNSGNSNTYLWNISGPENHTFTTSNIQFTPTTPGNYSVLLTVTSPDNCTATDSTTFVVYAQPTAPKVVVEGCIHEPPVEAISVSGETLLWSNGFRGTEAYYYNDGYLSAYYIDPTTGCPSEKAYAFIEPAPNYDALLTGCYEICSDSLTHQLPVYGFYPYHASQFQWFWFRDPTLIMQGTDLSPVLPLPNYGTYHLKTEYYDDYGNHCVSESPEFILENTFYCTCDSIQFKPENITCSVEGCKLIYTIRYTICNIGSHGFEFFNLQVPVGGELLSDNLPFDLPAGDCQTLEFSISLTDFTTTMFEFILRDRKQNCEISFVENLNWHTCVDSDCDIADFSFDFNPELSTAHQSSYFKFYAHIENAIEVLSMWSRPSQVIDFVYNGSDVEGLLMLDYGLLTQMRSNGQEFCLYMVSCVDDAQLCYDSLCIPAEQFFDVIPSEFRQLADNGSLDETLFEPTAEPLSLPAADKPYLAPNPAHNEVTVMGISSEKVVEIAVLTMKGEVVATHSLTHRFEIGRLANATYIVRVRTADNQIHYLKLVKQ